MAKQLLKKPKKPNLTPSPAHRRRWDWKLAVPGYLTRRERDGRASFVLEVHQMRETKYGYRILLAVLVTVSGLLWGWRITDSRGPIDVWRMIRGAEQARLPAQSNRDGSKTYTPVGFAATSPCPFIVKAHLQFAAVIETRCYIWFFGQIWQLPQCDTTDSVGNYRSLGRLLAQAFRDSATQHPTLASSLQYDFDFFDFWSGHS